MIPSNKSKQPSLKIEGASPSVIIICDEPETGYTWAHILNKKGIEVFLTESVAEAKKQIEVDQPDLVIIDEHTEKLNGQATIRELRPGSIFSIILFTHNYNENYILGAYQAGVDDCVANPVSPAMFLARVMANIRRTRCVPLDSLDNLVVAGFHLDPGKRELTLVDGQAIHLSQLEFRLLHLLMQKPGWAFKSEEIIERVWGFSGEGNAHLLKHLVFRLRRKVENDPRLPQYIISEPGVGYRFDA